MDDRKLIQLIKNNPDRGISEAMQLYGGAVRTIARSILASCNAELIDEVVSETFVKLWKNISYFKENDGASLKKYLYAIARNTAFDVLRKQEKNLSFEELDEIKELESAENIEKLIEQKELSELVYQLIESLGNPYNKVFLCKYYFDMKNKEIAEKLQLSEKQVENILYRGKGKLRKLFIQRGISRFAIIAASVLMLLSTASVAMEKYDLDIHMAETLGLSNVMPLLPDGSVYIGVSDSDAGVTLTAAEAIGDKFNQWIKIETNIPWKEGKEYYFDRTWNHVYGKDNIVQTGGNVFYCYEDDGMVSFMLNFVQYDSINKSQIRLELGQLMESNEYSDAPDYDPEETLYADGTWKLSWDNYYAANANTIYPMKLITSENSKGEVLKTLIYRAEISPVAIHLNAAALDPQRRADTETLKIESVVLKDGTVISCENTGGGGVENGVMLDKYISFGEIGLESLTEVEYIIVRGEKIELSIDIN